MALKTKSHRLFAGALNVTVSEDGSGEALVLLHGGAGPRSMVGLAERLSSGARVLVPTHPGFDGTQRPQWLKRPHDLVLSYLALFDALGLESVALVGNSFGGWLAAELALYAAPRVSRLVLLNAVGIAPSPGRVIVDPMQVAPAERTRLSFHDPAKGFAAPNEQQLAAMMANQSTLRLYAGEPFMHDPGLKARLPQISSPTLVGWGASDGIVGPDYGREWAQAIPGARFELIPEAGHFPHLEQLERVVELISSVK